MENIIQDRIIGSTPCVEYRACGHTEIKHRHFVSEAFRQAWVDTMRTIDAITGTDKHGQPIWTRV